MKELGLGRSRDTDTVLHSTGGASEQKVQDTMSQSAGCWGLEIRWKKGPNNMRDNYAWEFGRDGICNVRVKVK